MIDFRNKKEKYKSDMNLKSNKSETNSTKKLKTFKISSMVWPVEVNFLMPNGFKKSEKQKNNINKISKISTSNISINLNNKTKNSKIKEFQHKNSFNREQKRGNKNYKF